MEFRAQNGCPNFFEAKPILISILHADGDVVFDGNKGEEGEGEDEDEEDGILIGMVSIVVVFCRQQTDKSQELALSQFPSDVEKIRSIRTGAKYIPKIKRKGLTHVGHPRTVK